MSFSAENELIPQRRKVREIATGSIFARTYHVLVNDLGELPDRGDVMPFYDGEETDLLKPRVRDIKYGQQRAGAFQDVTLAFLQPVALSGGIATANFQELRSSRVEQPGQYRTESVVIGICSDITHADVPAKSDPFPGDEAEDLPRVCFSVTTDPNPFPGLFQVTARYRGSIGI